VNILSGAPYGYRYVKKTDTSAAYYEVLESQAGPFLLAPFIK
jgi:site-specific DNA recombinase